MGSNSIRSYRQRFVEWKAYKYNCRKRQDQGFYDPELPSPPYTPGRPDHMDMYHPVVAGMPEPAAAADRLGPPQYLAGTPSPTPPGYRPLYVDDGRGYGHGGRRLEGQGAGGGSSRTPRRDWADRSYLALDKYVSRALTRCLTLT